MSISCQFHANFMPKDKFATFFFGTWVWPPLWMLEQNDNIGWGGHPLMHQWTLQWIANPKQCYITILLEIINGQHKKWRIEPFTLIMYVHRRLFLHLWRLIAGKRPKTAALWWQQCATFPNTESEWLTLPASVSPPQGFGRPAQRVESGPVTQRRQPPKHRLQLVS